MNRNNLPTQEEKETAKAGNKAVAVLPEVISRALVGYFPLMAALPFEGRQPARITDGTRITSTVVELISQKQTKQ